MDINFTKFKAKFSEISGNAEGKKPLDWLTRPLASLRLGANPKVRILVIAAAGFLAIFVVILVVGIIFTLVRRGRGTGLSLVRPTPGAGVAFTAAPLIPSRYAQDAQVLAVEDSLSKIDKEMSTLDLRQSYLALPRISFDINFKK